MAVTSFSTQCNFNSKVFERRFKTIEITFEALAGLFQIDGTYILKMDGYPKDAVVVFADVDNGRGIVTLYLYHPDFEIIAEGIYVQNPIYITVERWDLPQQKHD